MSSNSIVYLDHNATTPLDPRVLEAMMPYFTEKFGNAASKNHAFGWEAEAAVDTAREQVAQLIGASAKEIIFTSGATESNNLAIKGCLKRGQAHFITCSTEHKAVLDPMQRLAKSGHLVDYLPVGTCGLISVDKLAATIKENTTLVSILFANNETGVIQPIKEMAEIARTHGALFMTDATQAVGKRSLDVNELGIDLLSLSGHKMYGPKGIGALYVRNKDPKVKLLAEMDGGGHEKGMRAGTLNVPGIVGLGMACELYQQESETEHMRLQLLRDKLESGLLQISGTKVNGNVEHRMAHVTNVSFDGLNGEQLMFALNDLAVSHGSACTSATFEASHVLRSMGLSDELAFASLRFSLGRSTTEEEIDHAIKRVNEVVDQLRH